EERIHGLIIVTIVTSPTRDNRPRLYSPSSAAAQSGDVAASTLCTCSVRTRGSGMARCFRMPTANPCLGCGDVLYSSQGTSFSPATCPAVWTVAPWVWYL